MATISEIANKRKAKLESGDYAGAPKVSRVVAPTGSQLRDDAKAIKIRQQAEKIPEAEVMRGVRKRKTGSSGY